MNDQTLRMAPVAAGQRIDTLDVLRGFALLGILLVNFEFFSRPIQAIVLGLDPSLEGIDRAVAIGTQVLAQGKFYSLFSLLFGMGFAVMLTRASERGAGIFGVYFRRIAILLGIGLAHALFIWSGDILVTYALFGFVMLLFFRRTPVGRLPKWGISLMLIPVLLMWLLALAVQGDPSGEAVEAFAGQEEVMLAKLAEAEQALRAGSYAEVSAVRLDDLAFMLSSLIFFGVGILGYFLLGAWFLRSGVIAESHAHQGFFRVLAPIGLVVGLALSAFGAWLVEGENFMIPTFRMAQANTVMTAGNLLLMLGYLSTIVLLLGHRAWGPRLRWLAPAGRMALTHYLTQSLFWTWMFYGYGLGLYGEVPRWAMPLLAVAFFAVQVQISHWWLARYRFGPAEWLWRSLTYLRLQPMRRVAETPT
jgi:uncharacterized protein